MPTPSGKPQVGETIFANSGEVVGVVVRRESGNCYSVQVRKDGKTRWITEYEWHAQRHGFVSKRVT